MASILIFNEPNITFDEIAQQNEKINPIQTENRTPYGRLVIQSQATKGEWTLKSVPVTFAKYASIQNYLKAKIYSPVSIYFDHLGGNITAQVILSAMRTIANGSNNYQVCDITIKEG